MTKECILKIKVEYCNGDCPCFYHKYEDKENCYCSRLDKKVYDWGQGGILDEWEDAITDHVHRPIPEECPLDEI
jgi:hypothetical protein